MKNKIILIILCLLLCSCSNSIKNKEYYAKIGSPEDTYSFTIGKNETIYLYSFGSMDSRFLLFDVLKDKKGYSLEMPKVTTKLHDDILLFDCPSSWGYTIKMTCLKEFSECININVLYIEFNDFIIEFPCDISLSYNPFYDENWIISNISEYRELTHFDYNKKNGLIKDLNEKDSFIIGIAPLYKRGTEQTIILNRIESLNENFRIVSTASSVGYITYKTWNISDLSFDEYNFPYTLDTSRTAYTYFSFKIDKASDYFAYGFDIKMSFIINGDMQEDVFHVVMR